MEITNQWAGFILMDVFHTNSLSMASNSRVCRLCSDLVHEKEHYSN